jgi:hypothetical protein
VTGSSLLELALSHVRKHCRKYSLLHKAEQVLLSILLISYSAYHDKNAAIIKHILYAQGKICEN